MNRWEVEMAGRKLTIGKVAAKAGVNTSTLRLINDNHFSRPGILIVADHPSYDAGLVVSQTHTTFAHGDRGL